jgi:hypothetical protein
MPANDWRPNLQALDGMLQVAMANGCGPDYERTVGNRFRHGFVLLGRRQHGGRAHGRAGPLKRNIVRIHHPQTPETEVAHSPGGGADVERIARVHQNHAQMIEFSRSRQAVSILRQPGALGLRLLQRSRRQVHEKQTQCTPVAVAFSRLAEQM